MTTDPPDGEEDNMEEAVRSTRHTRSQRAVSKDYDLLEIRFENLTRKYWRERAIFGVFLILYLLVVTVAIWQAYTCGRC